MPERIGRALAYALLIWLSGFAWGSVVFMTPALRNIAAIPYVSRYPTISFPLLLLWLLITYLLARSYLKVTTDKATEGLRLGVLFAIVNFVLDLTRLTIQKRLRLFRLPNRLARVLHIVNRALVYGSFADFH